MTDRILSVESLAGFPFSILERSYTASVSLTSAQDRPSAPARTSSPTRTYQRSTGTPNQP